MLELLAHLMHIPHPEGLDQLALQIIQSWVPGWWRRKEA
jgi:hypothetical protein